jgi:hypothetical protein
MGLSRLQLYFDSCIAIYLVEEHPVFAPLIEKRLARQTDSAATLIRVSGLTEMECLVMPLRHGNQPLLNKFRQWLIAMPKSCPLTVRSSGRRRNFALILRV